MQDPSTPSTAIHLTTAQAAAFLSLSRFTLIRYRNQHKGPPHITYNRENGRSTIRYALKDLEAWVNERMSR